jgi:hypothetical protein
MYGEEIILGVELNGLTPEQWAERQERRRALAAHLAATANNGAEMDPREVAEDPIVPRRYTVDI